MGKLKAVLIIVQHIATINSTEVMSFFGVELNSQINRLLLQIRLKLAQNKIHPNLRTIYRSFSNFDQQTSGLISSALFQKALNENGLFFKKFQIQAFQKAFMSQNGLLNWLQFLHNLKEPLGPYRRQVVQEIFDQIAGGKKQVTLAQLKQKFNSEGCDSFQKVIKDQKGRFNLLSSTLVIHNSEITKGEFLAYYEDLNINFPSDQAFVRYACNQWNLKEKKMEKVSEQKVKQIIKALRYKLIQKTNGTKDQFLIKKLFSEFDRNKNESIGPYELDLLLKRLQLPTESKIITPLLSVLDKNNSGYIQYEEFKKFIFFDPFPK